jgi:subtilisin family serine protease
MQRRLTAFIAMWGIVLSAMLPWWTVYADETEPFRTDPSGSMLPPPGYADLRQPLTVMLELGDSAAALPAGMMAPQSAPLDPVEIRRLLEAANIPILFQTHTAYNGIAVIATPDQLRLLRAIPGVVDIHVVAPKARSSTRAVSFIGAPQFWSATGHLTGNGVRIGIIDSGIDYTHATFGGSGTPDAFRSNDPTIIEAGTFPTEKVIAGYDFVGDAYDASGRLGSPIPNPDPDPLDCAGDGADAVRRISGGHGTHVASIAAGYGVDAAGRTYRGLYSGSVSYADFLVAPGVAPGASLVALKVFGCRGTTTFLTRAIDYAIDPNGDGNTDDRLVDVLNISLGSPFGGENDPDVVAINRAVDAGVVVVVAAGDTGGTFYAINSPSSAGKAIAVGASVDAGRDPSLSPDSLDLLTSRGPQRSRRLKPDLVAPGVALRSAAAGSGIGALALSGTSIATPQVAGAAALLRQLRPSWSPAQIKVALMNAAVPTRDAAGNLYPPSLAGAGRLDASRLFAWDVLAFDAEDPAAVSLSFGAPWISRSRSFQKTLRITNAGRFTRTLRLAPVLAADEPGVQVEVSPGPYELGAGQTLDLPVNVSVQPETLDFTPDATTPLLQAGVPPTFARYYMAEHSGVIEVRSTLGARIRAAHAGDFDRVTVYVGEQLLEESIRPARVGRYIPFRPGRQQVRVLPPGAPPTTPPLVAAEFDVVDGRDYTIVVYGSWSRPQLALVDEIPEPSLPRDQIMIHVFNGDPLRDGSAVDVYLDNVLLVANLPVGAASAFSVTTPGAHKVRFFRAGSSPATSSSAASKEFVAGSGEVILVVGGGNSSWSLRGFTGRGRLINEQTTRVPFQIVPKSAAESAATATEQIVPDAVPSFTITLRNSGARNQLTSPRGAQTPLVSAYELAPEGRSPEIIGLNPALRPADIRYVGVTSSYPERGWEGNNTVIFFGMAGYAAWATPNEVQYRVYISTTGPGGSGPPDDIPEFMLVNTSIGAILPIPGTGGVTRPDDTFRSILYRFQPDGTLQLLRIADWNFVPPPTASPFLDSAPFETSVLALVTTAGFLELSPAAPVFSYYVETYARDAGEFTERVDRVPSSGVITYDLRSAAVAPLNTSPATGVVRSGLPTPFFFGIDGAQIAGTVNQDVLAVRRTQDVLLLHHHNAVSAQAEVVTLQSSRSSPSTTPPGGYRVYLPIITTP